MPWQAEENSVRTKRVKSGGNKKKSFTEGWVEFADKKRAMRIARTLNNTQASVCIAATRRAAGS